MLLDWQLLFVALMIGLGSTGHCMMMCGGISSALAANLSPNISNSRQTSRGEKFSKLLLFHLGRISCYSLLGLLIGDLLLGQLLTISPAFSQQLIFISRLVAALMIILIGLYVSGISKILQILEHKLSFIWKKLQPTVQKFIQIKHFHHAFILGFFWGFLPCGIIYSTLIWASSNTVNMHAVFLMLAFGIGTLPGMLAINLASQQTLSTIRRRFPKKALGIALIVFGAWTLAVVIFMPDHSMHHMH